MLRGQKRSLLSHYLGYFADYFSWGVAFAFLTISTDDLPFKHLTWKPEVWIWIIYAVYPIGEFFGYPIFADLSERIGTKKILIWGHLGSIMGMILCSFALWIQYFTLFLVGQFLVAVFSGKMGTAQAAIIESPVGTKKQKTAILTVLGTIGWMLGPVLGGLLLAKSYFLPNLLGCLIYLVSLVFTKFFLTDTEIPIPQDRSPRKFLKNVGDLFILAWEERPFFIFLLNLIGWYLLAVSAANFLASRFCITDCKIDVVSSNLSFYLTLFGGIGAIGIFRYRRSKNILMWSFLFLISGICIVFGINQLIENWAYLAIPALTEAWIYPTYQTVLSADTNGKSQGKLYALIGASDGVCQFTAYLILGGISTQLSILIAALLFICSAALLPNLNRKKASLKAA